MFQFPSWGVELPGRAYSGGDPDGFSHKSEVLAMVCRAGGFHDHERDIAIDKPLLELTAGKAVLLDQLSLIIGHGQFETRTLPGQPRGSSMYPGPPFVIDQLTPT